MAKQGELTPKQKRFCEEYLIDLNGTQAAIRAGYSKKTAGQIADENLKKPEIKAFIAQRQGELQKSTEITQERVLKELAKVGFANIQDFVKEGFTVEDIQALSKDQAAAVQSISVETAETKNGTFTTVKFKLHDKLSALEKIGKHIGFFKEDNIQGATKIIIEGG